MDDTRDKLRQIIVDNGITKPSDKMLDDIAVLFNIDYKNSILAARIDELDKARDAALSLNESGVCMYFYNREDELAAKDKEIK